MSKRVFDENLFWLFVSGLFSIFIKTKVPVLQTNLIVLERILVVSKIVTKPNTLYMKIFKHLIHFLYLMRLIFVIISSYDQAESDKTSSKGKFSMIVYIFRSQFVYYFFKVSWLFWEFVGILLELSLIVYFRCVGVGLVV